VLFADVRDAMQITASADVSRLCISSIRNSAPDWLACATSPISSSSSVRSCSGSPESATPVAASTSSLSWIAPGTAMLNAFTTPSARSTRSLIRCFRLISRSSRAAMRANVIRKSGCDPTSCTSARQLRQPLNALALLAFDPTVLTHLRSAQQPEARARRKNRNRLTAAAGAGALAPLLVGDLLVMGQPRAQLVEHPDGLRKFRILVEPTESQHGLRNRAHWQRRRSGVAAIR
jgi:hypothetical protein